MGWTDRELGSSHEGAPVALLADGSEPKPVYFDAGSGAGGEAVSHWWIYDGTLGAPLAAYLRGSCACGWRGEKRYPVDEAEMTDDPRGIDTTGPCQDWERHIEEVRGRTVPLPEELEDSLTRVEQQVATLMGDAPLAALRALAGLERIVGSLAPEAAYAVEADELSWETVAAALGLTEEKARSRLLRYQLQGMRSREW
ncbi:hypothetical protein [Streptomyces daliensis]|uniref:Uncharacterized protein n=1 Tax=Streptomyces daliensis TaxID=299421 RepID=A0A8T4IQ49_9ACTN|nr:hypothetical protein [Streptomyces daliensis]